MKSQKQILQWIREKLNTRDIEGFEWYDEEQEIFRLPWPHGSASHWNVASTKVFVEWAIYKGRMKKGNPNYKQLKARFRCAMNSKKELHELKELRTKTLRFWQIVSTAKHSKTKSNSTKRKPNKRDMVNQAVNSLPQTDIKNEVSKQDFDIYKTVLPCFQNDIQPSDVLQNSSRLPSSDVLRYFPPSPPEENRKDLLSNLSPISFDENGIQTERLQSSNQLPSFDILRYNLPPSPMETNVLYNLPVSFNEIEKVENTSETEIQMTDLKTVGQLPTLSDVNTIFNFFQENLDFPDSMNLEIEEKQKNQDTNYCELFDTQNYMPSLNTTANLLFSENLPNIDFTDLFKL